jgi:hypothetical protein
VVGLKGQKVGNGFLLGPSDKSWIGAKTVS